MKFRVHLRNVDKFDFLSDFEGLLKFCDMKKPKTKKKKKRGGTDLRYMTDPLGEGVQVDRFDDLVRGPLHLTQTNAA